MTKANSQEVIGLGQQFQQSALGAGSAAVDSGGIMLKVTLESQAWNKPGKLVFTQNGTAYISSLTLEKIKFCK